MARDRTARGRRRAEDGERSWTSSRVGPTARGVLACRLHAMRQVLHSASLQHEYRAVRCAVGHRAWSRCVRVGRAVVSPMRGESCLRHAGLHLSRPSSLHAQVAWPPASMAVGPGSRSGLGSSTLLWLRAVRRQALPAAAVRARLRSWIHSWSGGRWEPTGKGRTSLWEPSPGWFSAWVEVAIGTGGKLPSAQGQMG